MYTQESSNSLPKESVFVASTAELGSTYSDASLVGHPYQWQRRPVVLKQEQIANLHPAYSA